MALLYDSSEPIERAGQIVGSLLAIAIFAFLVLLVISQYVHIW